MRGIGYHSYRPRDKARDWIVVAFCAGFVLGMVFTLASLP